MRSPRDRERSLANDKKKALTLRIFRNRFVARVFLTSFIGVHVPLLCAGGYVLTRSTGIDWTLLAVLTAATVAGTLGTILLLHRELKPVISITRSLQQFAETRVRRPIAHRSNDEIGELAAAAEWAIETVDGLLRKLEEEARTDSLTGLPNRRAFIDMIAQKPLASLALIDIDSFKSVNDSYGHEVGDLALCNFSRILVSELGPSDVLARWGGEEFILYLGEDDPEDARAVLDDARKAVADAAIIPGRRITFSAGIVAMSGSIDADAASADALLYSAKKAGRNRIATPGDAIGEHSAELLDCLPVGGGRGYARKRS
mgnify:CR=1 FL=1